MLIFGNKNMRVLNNVKKQVVTIKGTNNLIIAIDSILEVNVKGDGNKLQFVGSKCDVTIKGNSNNVVMLKQSKGRVVIEGENNRVYNRNCDVEIINQRQSSNRASTPVNNQLVDRSHGQSRNIQTKNRGVVNQRRRVSEIRENQMMEYFGFPRRLPSHFGLRQSREEPRQQFMLPCIRPEDQNRQMRVETIFESSVFGYQSWDVSSQNGLTEKELSLLAISHPRNCSTQCSICMDQILTIEQQTFLPCLHALHWKCAKLWLSNSIVCPICKTNVKEVLNKLRNGQFLFDC